MFQGFLNIFLDVWQPEVDSQEATTHQLERYTESWPVTKGAFFNPKFWNKNDQNEKCARFSMLHSYSGMDRTPFQPFCSQGQNEQNVVNENPRWGTAR